eukprot:7387826-Prymnesium_polylepis.1
MRCPTPWLIGAVLVEHVCALGCDPRASGPPSRPTARLRSRRFQAHSHALLASRCCLVAVATACCAAVP